jgi:hypothetical protein
MTHAMRSRSLSRLLALPLLSVFLLVACHTRKQYEATVEMTRMSVVRKDDVGVALTTDFEFSYFECPGTQVEVIRGGKEFSACVQKFKVGDKVKVKLEHYFDSEGVYDYDVFDVEGCPRPADPNDEASFKMVRECFDWNVNGARVGFQCSYENKRELTNKCPWFKKH